MPPLDIFGGAPVLQNSVCNTTACIAASKYIRNHINFNVDPCSDFYQYTCGTWINSPPVREAYDQGEKTTEFTEWRIENNKKQMQIIEGTYEDFKKNIKSNGTGFHLDEQADLDKSNFDFFKSYYDVCKDVSLYNATGFTPIFEDIAMLQKEIVPVNATASQYGRAMAFFLQQGISILPFQAKLDISVEDHNRPKVMIGNTEALLSYTYDHDILLSLLAQAVGQPETNDYNAQVIIEASQRSGLELWSNSTIHTAADNYERIFSIIINAFNSSSSGLTFDSEGMSNYPSIPFADIQQALPAIDISVLLTTLSEGLEASAVPNFYYESSSAFLRYINDMFSTESKKSIQDFFVVRYIIDKYEHLSPTFLPELLSKTMPQLQDSAASNEMRTECSADTSMHFAFGLGRYYALENFGDENDRQKVLKFIENIRESLLIRIANSSWLDDQTKQAAIKKMKLAMTDAAYSISDPDWRSPDSIKQYYGNQTIDTRSYYHAKKAALLSTSKRNWNITSKMTQRIWDSLKYPDDLNAFYLSSSNSIAVLAGILRKPIYSTDVPEYLNFGSLGSAIGHEFVHGLDNEGRQFNGTGHLEDWWTPQTTKEYEERQQCFVEDYSKISILDEEGNKVFVDGEQTLGENIADAGGLSAAVDAYRIYIDKERQGQPEPSLPGFEQLTADQMLYISFGLFHCESLPPNHARDYERDEHAPNFARTNAVVQNSADFATVFNCQANTPMNKEEKCFLW
ncbi:hypothetical protein BD560DRAFT_360668 [Blakeslea trispora]|nr:hypothetical protein BD560DRAFT_360668 [Blakeslea trispora]